MISSRRLRIQDLVISIQQAFLDTSGLRLTLSQARRRFSSDATACSAVLNVLVEAGVLMRTSTGQYARLLPRTAHAPEFRAHDDSGRDVFGSHQPMHQPSAIG
jgi:hypothetical protein